jgi:hypothetical protein
LNLIRLGSFNGAHYIKRRSNGKLARPPQKRTWLRRKAKAKGKSPETGTILTFAFCLAPFAFAFPQGYSPSRLTRSL